MSKRLPSLDASLMARGPFVVRRDARYVGLARASWVAHRRAWGFNGDADILATNPKMDKNERATLGLTLSAAGSSNVVDTCDMKTTACENLCVVAKSFYGQMTSSERARACRTAFLYEQPEYALALIAWELARAVGKFGRVMVRLNVASDLRWELFAPGLFRTTGATFYDYTKHAPTNRGNAGTMPRNYRLTFSLSERRTSDTVARDYLANGGTVTVVFDTRKGKPLPSSYLGARVIDGDLHDDRTRDGSSVIVGLRAKGMARGIVGTETGFIRHGIPVTVS